MKLMEDICLEHSIEIRAKPEDIFAFFFGLVDDASYRAWHPEDHPKLQTCR